MIKRNNKLNDLVSSLEAFAESPVDEVTQQDLNDDLNSIDEAQASLESYQQAYGLLLDLDKKDVLSMETYQAVMSLTESGLKPGFAVSMEDDNENERVNESIRRGSEKMQAEHNAKASGTSDNKESFLKRAKDKIIAAFKWLMEKISNMFKRMYDFIKKAFDALAERSKKVADWFKEATGLKKDVTLNVIDVHLILEDSKSFYKPSNIAKAVDYLYGDLPEACAEFIESVADGIDRQQISFSDQDSEAKLQNLFSDAEKKSVNKILKAGTEGKVIHTNSEGTDFKKLKGANVAVGASWDDSENNDKFVAKVVWAEHEMATLNPKVRDDVDTISITTSKYNDLKELSNMLEDKVNEYKNKMNVDKERKINASLTTLRNDIMSSLLKSKKGTEEAQTSTDTFLTTLITKNLGGAFRLRAESEQAATHILMATNKLLWKVYKANTETTETSDSKEVVKAA